MSLKLLFIDPSKIDGVFAKILTPNDDSGRHGVVVPVAAHSFFPSFPGLEQATDVNHTVPILTTIRYDGATTTRKSNYKYYQRYPERRLTALRSEAINAAPHGTLVVVGRCTDVDARYELHVIHPIDPIYVGLLDELGIEEPRPGAFRVFGKWSVSADALQLSQNVKDLVAKFDELHAQGYHEGQFAGPRNVGNTFEVLMGGSENNSPNADVDGVELKSMVRSEFKKGLGGEMDLFLKEPTWIDGTANTADRVHKYGYLDDKGRQGLKVRVQILPNAQGLLLQVDRTQRRLYLMHGDTRIAFWPFDALEKPLRKKLKDTLHSFADAKKHGGAVVFRYHTLYFLGNASVDAMMKAIEEGGVRLELRMHDESEGGPRNHGCQFRAKLSFLPKLFSDVLHLRGSDWGL